MKYMSEKTNKVYDTIEACEEAEREFDEIVAKREEERKKREEEKKAKVAERAARAKEVEDVFNEAREAQKRYQEVLNSFLKDYGSFHYTVHDGNDFHTLVSEFFRGL